MSDIINILRLIAEENGQRIENGTWNVQRGVENQNNMLWGNHGADMLNGDALGDWLVGGGGNDFLIGDRSDDVGGPDFLFGGKGHDIIDGDAGDDFLYGGSGTDILTGDMGRDYLTGGSGADAFSFDLKKGEAMGDVISDFNYDEGDVIMVDDKSLILDIYNSDTNPSTVYIFVADSTTVWNYIEVLNADASQVESSIIEEGAVFI
ncbi:MAG: calcium-binding protein [Methyloligellaceae bacterium]